jgi:glycosyltransferase involved in cell wall biosynthesis
VPQLLAASDLFVFPSRYEGMPGALIEACAAGLPVVCTDLPCMTEVVQPHVNALLFPLNHQQLLAQQLELLISNAELRNTMGAESLAIFHQKFTLESIHLQMEALIQQMASQ